MFDPALDPEHPFGQDASMGRTRVRRRRAFTVLALLVCLLVTGPVSRAFAPGGQGDATGRRVYVVQAGDTVWSIAARFSKGADPRELVDAIGRRNRIDVGAIVPGQALVIPWVA
jgi:hypothetical protein